MLPSHTPPPPSPLLTPHVCGGIQLDCRRPLEQPRHPRTRQHPPPLRKETPAPIHIPQVTFLAQLDGKWGWIGLGLSDGGMKVITQLGGGGGGNAGG